MKKDARKIDMYYAVGEGIHQWGLLENELSKSFSMAVGGCQLNTLGASTASFSKVQSFRNKLELTHSAISATMLPEELRCKWERIHVKLGRKNRARNEIAHFQIDESGDHLVLRPFYSRGAHIAKMMTAITTDISKISPEDASIIVEDTKGKSLDAHDVWNRAKSFAFLVDRLESFNKELETYIMFTKDFLQNEAEMILEDYWG